MEEVSSSDRSIVRFGVFDLDLRSGELRKSGVRVKLADQPFRVLAVLLEHPGDLVTRDELRSRVWPADTFVDFEHGLNAGIKRLRDALGDSAEHPRYIETVPKRGYRFIAPIDSEPTAPVGAAELETEPAVEAPRPRVWTRRRAAIIGSIAAVSIAGSFVWWWTSPGRALPNPDVPRQLTRVTIDPGLQTDPSFSPDGQSIAYASNKSGNLDIWIQPVAGGEAVQLTSDPADDSQPDWSPDGGSIVFRSDRDGGGIFTVSPVDRHVERLTRSGYRPRWSPDGSRLLFAGGSWGGFWKDYYVAAADGTRAVRIELPELLDRGLMIAAGWHPSGRLVFLHGSGPLLGLAAVDPGGSKAKPRRMSTAVRDKFVALSLVVESGQPLAWSAEGRTMYFVADANGVKDIWRLTVDPESLAAVSGPERVTTSNGWNLAPAMSRTGGRLVFSRSSGSLRVWLFALEDRRRISKAQPRALTTPELDATQPALSPDGRSLVIVGQHPGARRKLGLMMFSVDDPLQVVTLRTIDAEAGEDMFGPRWSPDGSKVAYSYRRVSPGTPPTVSSSIRVIDARSRQESAMTSMWTIRRLGADNPWGWSLDGRWLLATGDSWTGLVRLKVSDAPRAERTARALVTSSSYAYFQASPSPDGRWVCAVRSKGFSDSAALVLIPAEGGEPVPLLDETSWDDKPRWSDDGRIIYFLSRRGGGFDVWGVEFDSLHGRAAGPPFQITHFQSPEMRLPGLDRIGEAEISIVKDRLALPLQTLGGGIWMLQ